MLIKFYLKVVRAMEETRLKEKVLKKDFCTTIQNYTYSKTGKRWNYEDAALGYDAFVASLKALLATYGKVMIEGYGYFEVISKKGKKVNNNLNVNTKHETKGNVICVPGFQTVVFRISDKFKEEIKSLDYKFVDNENDGGDD